MSQTFNSIIQNIKDNISDIPLREPNLIYIGVGTFAGLMTVKYDKDNKEESRFLEPMNYHQYPPFLKELKHTNPNLHLQIVLIDPMQENPPYMVNDTKYTNDEFYEETENKFVSYDGRIHLYVLRQSVTIGKIFQHSIDSCIDISDELHDLNQFCIQSDISLLCHDYTGRNMKLIAEYFDKTLGENIDKIVYGFGARADFGCYFDLTKPVARYPFRIERGNVRYFLRFANLYKFIRTRQFNAIEENNKEGRMSRQEQLILREHLDEFFRTIKSNVLNNMMYSLRTVYHINKGILSDLNENLFSRFEPAIMDEFIMLYRTKQFSRLFEALLEYYSDEMDIYAKLQHFDVSGYEMLKIITSNPDPYKWCDELKQFYF
jgi:hypothetical protein